MKIQKMLIWVLEYEDGPWWTQAETEIKIAAPALNMMRLCCPFQL